MSAPRPTTALRQRMIQDLQLAGRSERTQEAYVRAVRKLSDHYRQSPDHLSERFGGRALRVVFDPNMIPPRIVTVYFDRSIKDPP